MQHSSIPIPVGSGRAPGPFPGARGPCPQPALFVVEGRRCPVTITKLAGAARISRRRDPESLAESTSNVPKMN